ncbi:Guanylate kinase [Pseudobutyrivibrio sp. NOR37]|uniref:Guanylate kinase n=2 Tax=Pseudobutyrivibrio TaxID=46205 RepID=A0A2G3EBF3_9FIRM|nr:MULTISPECIES: guanylate kinase [Pseudobutyrivibrio]NEX02039.1 guanylate kinase [Pseudobutyrivibrio xylanivorans]PHU40622.1 guanylate kinase [Pseudobutyrivibrio ruminis]SFR73804.1 Guanylate kinase [Pseudobutyrivibrio sp. NOR37]
MGNIYCIMGKSSSGKDTIFKLLLDRTDIDLKTIVSYTTRPIRSHEKPGEEYNFVSIEEKDRLVAEGKVIELREYNTVHGPWFYFTVDDGSLDLEHHDYLIIGTVESFVKIRDYYGEDKVLPIYIEVDDGIRLTRALEREKMQENPKYEEMCRRFLADQQDFSEENIRNARITNVFNNNKDSKETCDKIAAFINGR